MEKNCLIVEDNAAQRNLIGQLISEISDELHIFAAGNLWEAYRILLEEAIDVFIIDIMLEKDRKGDVSGVKLVNIIRALPQYCFTPVIFVTSLEDPKLFAYEKLHCFGYLEKPYNRDEIKEIVKCALGYTTPRREQEILCLRKDGVLYPFRIDRIIYIESQNRNIMIHERDGKSEKMPYMTCRQILEEANNSALLQCSRGTIVNRNYVKTIDKANRMIDLNECGTQLMMGGVYVKNIIRAFCNEYENI